MKYIKSYESIENEPKIGDYVLCDEETTDHDVKEFVKTHIGKLVLIQDILVTNYNYKIYYNDSDKYFGNNGNHRSMTRSEIKHWSENIEDILPFLSSNKYNM